jgi:hypothetical protein
MRFNRLFIDLLHYNCYRKHVSVISTNALDGRFVCEMRRLTFYRFEIESNGKEIICRRTSLQDFRR